MPVNSQKSIQALSFLQGILWILLLFPINLVYKNILAGHLLLSWAVLIAATLAAISLIIIRTERQAIQINFVDILITGYSGYILFNALVVRPYPVPDSFWLKFSTVLLIYFSSRMMSGRQKNIILTVIAIAGFAEAVYIILQQSGLLESEHLIFNFTGSFSNPGLVAGFMSSSLCVFIYFLLQSYKHWRKVFLSIGIALLVYTLFLTNSRAGWLAASSGIIYLLWNSKNKFMNRLISKIKKRQIFKILFILIILGGLLFTYQYKKSSADGRLFIWQNSLEMVKDKPIMGHGMGMFRSKYPHYQANFFRENPNSEKAMIAGNPSTPFNEYLYVLTTQGFVGFAFLTAILVSLFLYQSVLVSERQQKAFLLVFCIFAFFSYPTKDSRLLILLPFFIASLPSRAINCTPKLNSLFIYGMILCGVFYGTKTMREYKYLEISCQLHIPMTENQYKKIKYDITLFQKYCLFTEKLSDSSTKFFVMKDYVELYPSSYGLCELGKKYKAWNKLDEATDCFILASQMNPSLMTPNYELFLLYQSHGDKKNIRETGQKILKQLIKKEGTLSLKMKAYVRKALSELSE